MKKSITKTDNKVKDNATKSDKKTITKEHRTGTDEYGSGLDPKRGNYRSKQQKDA